MIGKTLFTLLVILAALSWLRYQGAVRPGPNATQRPSPPARTPYYLAFGVAALFVISGGLYWYGQWQHARAVLEIHVSHPGSGQVTTYQARREAINGRRFTTLDGRDISLSADERMELRETPERP